MTYVYQPVVYAQSGAYRGAALVGTHSVVIGWSFDDPALRKGLLGFAIRRTDMDPVTGEVMRLEWLGGYKKFKETDDGRANDSRSLDAPFQRFRWNDYTLKPQRAYRYEIFPMRGCPGALTRDEVPLCFEFCPSEEDANGLGIYVNRGVTAAMAYMQRFKNQHPSDVGPAAYSWLSHGLKESLLGFIASAKRGQALHVAIYEFFDHEIAQAFKDALGRGVDVQIAHDAKPGKKSTAKTEEVIHLFGLKEITFPRTTVNISHNKIVVWLVNGTPKEVWTGSANFSENAFNYQTNTALIVRDPDVVRHYEDFFQALKPDPAKAESKILNRKIMDRANSIDGRFAEQTFFSPIKSEDILDCSKELIASAESAVLISAPFGVDKKMLGALHGNFGRVLQYGLINSTAKRKVETLQKVSTRFFPPNYLKSYLGRKWDAKAFGNHKIHAKSIVIDPFGSNPKVLIGSANFSKPSCVHNDENAMLITGNKRLSSIITTEFMRMYDHYKSRYYIDLFNDKNKEIIRENKKREAKGLDSLPLKTMDHHLKSNDSWSRTAYDPKTKYHKFHDRIVFSGAQI